MARLIFLVIVIGVVAMVTIFIAASLQSAAKAGQEMVQGKGTAMTPTGLQKFAYVALIVLMIGTASGLLGSM